MNKDAISFWNANLKGIKFTFGLYENKIAYLGAGFDDIHAWAGEHNLTLTPEKNQELRALMENKVKLAMVNQSPFKFEDFKLFGTDFQKAVWKGLYETKWGSTITYAKLAEKIQHAKAARAVGSALGQNAILFLIPCHRVVNKDPKKINFRSGVDLKIKLMDLEA